MFLSVVRIRLIYSPFYGLLRPLKPLERFVYRKLRQPAPRSGPDRQETPASASASPNKTVRLLLLACVMAAIVRAILFLGR